MTDTKDVARRTADLLHGFDRVDEATTIRVNYGL